MVCALPSCGPGFECRIQHLFRFQLIMINFILNLLLDCLKNENKHREAGNGPFLTSRQCDQVPKLFLSIWPSTTLKTCPIVKKIATFGPIFRQILNRPSKICPRLLRMCQNGEISPNLVTLQVGKQCKVS